MASPRSNRATQLCGVPLSRARCSPVALRHDSRRRQESAERGCTRSETVAAERTVRRCFSSSHRHGKGRWSDERRQPGASQTCVENARKMVFRHMFSTQVSASGELVATVTPGAIWHVFADAIWHGAVCEASSVAARWRHDSCETGSEVELPVKLAWNLLSCGCCVSGSLTGHPASSGDDFTASIDLFKPFLAECQSFRNLFATSSFICRKLVSWPSPSRVRRTVCRRG